MRMLILAAVLVGACTRPPATTDTAQAASPDVVSSSTGVTLRLDRASYRSAAPVTLRLVNATNNSYAFNPCARVVDRETGGRWSPVQEERMCTMIAHILEPRSTRVEQTELPEGLTAGRYRMSIAMSIAMSVEGSGAPARTLRVTGAPFSITP